MNISLHASRHLVRMGNCHGGCTNCPNKSHVCSSISTDLAMKDPRKEELSGCSTGTPRTRRPVVGIKGWVAMCRNYSCSCRAGGRVGVREESVCKPGPHMTHFLKFRETPTAANSWCKNVKRVSSRSGVGTQMVPSSRYHELKGREVGKRSRMELIVIQKRRGTNGSPCCTPVELSKECDPKNRKEG